MAFNERLQRASMDSKGIEVRQQICSLQIRIPFRFGRKYLTASPHQNIKLNKKQAQQNQKQNEGSNLRGGSFMLPSQVPSLSFSVSLRILLFHFFFWFYFVYFLNLHVDTWNMRSMYIAYSSKQYVVCCLFFFFLFFHLSFYFSVFLLSLCLSLMNLRHIAPARHQAAS